MINCPLCEAVSRTFGLSIARYVSTFIFNQGGTPSSCAVRALQALDLEPLMAGAIFRPLNKPKKNGWVP